ncbi:MAG: hypothetical protein H6739_42200 [Alphaproteobacteria bacterium]|nr:hypothetical protein [Alphaproteobacteria bacterium]
MTQLAEGLPPAHTLLASEHAIGLVHETGVTLLDSTSFAQLLRVDGPIHAACLDGERLRVVAGDTLLEQRADGWDRRALATPADPVISAAVGGHWVAWSTNGQAEPGTAPIAATVHRMDLRDEDTTTLALGDRAGPELSCLAVTPSGLLLAAGRYTEWEDVFEYEVFRWHELVWVWRLADRQLLGIVDLGWQSGELDPVDAPTVGMSADDRWITVVVDGEVSLLPTEALWAARPSSSPQAPLTIPCAHVGGPSAFTPDGRSILCLSSPDWALYSCHQIRAGITAMRAQGRASPLNTWRAVKPIWRHPAPIPGVTAVAAPPGWGAALMVDQWGTLWRLELW